MSNFKFTEAEREKIYLYILDRIPETPYQSAAPIDVIDTVEQIVNDRDGWISVEDWLPEQDTFVIGHKHNGLVLGLYFNADYEFKYGDQYQTEQVTHWQPLPNPPKSKQ